MSVFSSLWWKAPSRETEWGEAWCWQLLRRTFGASCVTVNTCVLACRCDFRCKPGCSACESYLLCWGCGGRSEAPCLCELRWWRGCWGPPQTVWVERAAEPAAEGPVAAALPAEPGRSELCWRGCHSLRGTPPGPYTRAESCLHRREGSCPRGSGRGKLTVGGWLRCSRRPTSSPSLCLSQILQKCAHSQLIVFQRRYIKGQHMSTNRKKAWGFTLKDHFK